VQPPAQVFYFNGHALIQNIMNRKILLKSKRQKSFFLMFYYFELSTFIVVSCGVRDKIKE
jgi:hypothetical protein